MDLGAVLLLVALVVVVGLYLSAPLLRSVDRPVAARSLETSSLMAERDRLIAALQELDFDHQLEKVPEEHYQVQRRTLLEQGAAVLRRLDAIAPAPGTGSAVPLDPNARLEQAAAAGRPDGAASYAAVDDRLESMLAARRAARHAKSAGFCPRCGKPILVTDEFCSHCGKRLKPA